MPALQASASEIPNFDSRLLIRKRASRSAQSYLMATTRVVAGRHAGVLPRRPLPGGNRMLEMTNENFARRSNDRRGQSKEPYTLVSVSCGRDQGFALFIWCGRRPVLQKSPNVPGKL